MEKLHIASFEEMKASKTEFDFADYVHFVLQQVKGDDFLVILGHLFNPEMHEIEGRLLVSSIGAVEKYKRYREQDQTPAQAQFWANLFLISEFFEGDVAAKEFATLLADCWQRKANGSISDKCQTVHIIEDNEDGICLTLADPATAP